MVNEYAFTKGNCIYKGDKYYDVSLNTKLGGNIRR